MCWTHLPYHKVVLYNWVNWCFQAWCKFACQKNMRYLPGTWHWNVGQRTQHSGEAVCLACSSLKYFYFQWAVKILMWGTQRPEHQRQVIPACLNTKPGLSTSRRSRVTKICADTPDSPRRAALPPTPVNCSVPSATHNPRRCWHLRNQSSTLAN